MLVLVSGGAGLLGSYVCDLLLEKGYEVRAMTHYHTDNLEHIKDKVEIVKADIRFKCECLEASEGVDAIIHTAACIHVDRSRRYPGIFYETNVKGTMNLLEACRKEDAKFVQMSSCEVLGNIPEGKADESFSFKQPLSPYASSKHAAESYCHAYQATYDLPINIIRGFNLCGPRQKLGEKGAVIPRFIDMVLKGHPPIIYGSGEQTRDYVDARDIAKGIVMLLESDYRGELFHLCSGNEISIRELAVKIIETCGELQRPVHIERRPGELMRSVGDYSKAEKLLGWTPSISLDQSLKDTVEYLRSQTKNI